ncbi:alpha-mannosidase [Streptosporangium album]|uniref:Alpha-mannosidase n=1 Tax=Streptosporangium album TaxID=47479 RepID=A0A7W7RXK2_9ACTN|nr:glycoside hydrolase family 38 C-terminal domain-containing protein [Streptosporangium album]MBB4940119.1 alpha-mannosidase [Streptosporangium album]
MHDNRLIVEGRLARFVQQFLPAALYRERRPLAVEAWNVPGEPVPAAEAFQARYTPITLPHNWGTPWGTTWFHATGRVPDELPEGTRLEIVVDLGFHGRRPGFQVEGLGYRADGSLIKAVAPLSQYLPWSLAEPVVDVYVEAAANPDVAGEYTYEPTALGDRTTAGTDPIYRLRSFDLALLDVGVWELAQDVWTLDGLMRELSVDSSRRWEILRAFERMLDVVDPADVHGTAGLGRDALVEVLAAPAPASSHRVVAVGHAHIDSAWLWPVRETIRKCARTFASAVTLMDENPDYRFACSSAQQLAWVKRHYPPLFERIRKKVESGQFIPVGGMWVEPDINMPGGESMARQFVAGKRFFLEEFGVDTLEAWVPDTFGYSAAMPQIIAASGTRWFMTQKISWNQVNEIPHSTFQWEGIDGTRVFTHFPPADTYVSELSGAELAHAARTFKEKGVAATSLVPFGWGDGGGGPTREMLAAAKRLESLDGSPTVVIDSPRAFFEQAEAEYENPPVWSGELYLELHRGTLTTQHLTKQGNRRGEHLLREAELWAATAAVREGAAYPYDELEEIWHTVLLQQFHDILPGTSIAWVHDEVEQNNAALQVALARIVEESVRVLVGEGERTLTANARPFADGGVAALGIQEGAPEGGPVPLTEEGAGYVLDNGAVRAVIDRSGHLVSLRDAATGREAIAPGAVGNLLLLHRDVPNAWDAWDIDEHYRRVARRIDEVDSLETQADAVVVTRRFGASTIRQTLRLSSSGLEVVNEVDWHERHALLKLVFPVDVHADRFASETQFGHVFRPTHTNTSWDAARFEVCAHRWIHVGEPGYGVAIANESTYGHDVVRHTRADGGTTTTIGLSMLRGPRFPDPDADQGQHTITYVVRPAAGIREAVAEGYRANLPARAVRGAREVEPLVRVSHPAVVVEAVKLAEDRSGDVIVRLYESEGAKASTQIRAGFDSGEPRFVDLIERDVEPPASAAFDDGAVSVMLRPFQLVTLRFPRG